MAVARQKLLFLTDSLGFPRAAPELVTDDEVWISHVARATRDRYDASYFMVPGLHTQLIASSLKTTLGAFNPDVIVLQVGIVDCAPKALREAELKVVVRLPAFVRQRIHKFLHAHYQDIVTRRDIVYVTPRDFVGNLTTLRSHFAAARFVVVPIAPANAAYVSKNPLIARNIGRYNALLAEVFGDAVLSAAYDRVDLDRAFLSDHHHLAPSGHRAVADAVIERLL